MLARATLSSAFPAPRHWLSYLLYDRPNPVQYVGSKIDFTFNPGGRNDENMQANCSRVFQRPRSFTDGSQGRCQATRDF